MTFKLDSKSPTGPIEQRWTKHKFDMKLVNPANKRKYKVIVVGTGLAGGSAAATLAELGYQVECFCFQDSPRRAHSIAAQGGINGAKNYRNDGDSVFRLFYDTVKGGEWRARESNVYRLAEVSVNIIDQCVAQGVPFAREYGGLLDNRSFGGAQVSRTFYARGQTGQQLLIGAYQALERQIGLGSVKMHTRHEMMELVVIDGRARGIIARDLVTGEITSHAADTVVLGTGGYGNVFFLSTNAKGCNVTANWRAYKKGAGFANPCFTQIHPTCIPVSGDYQSKLTLMSESLRNDGRVWVPKQPGDARNPAEIPEGERDYILERKYPSYGNLAPRDVSSRAAKEACDAGKGVGPGGRGVFLDFADAIKRVGEPTVKERYGNLFDMYQTITGDNPYQRPMRIYPAVHYTMGGLWVDYNLQSTLPGLHVIGEANFSDHGANRLGASALMQGLADGYFILPYTLGHYLATEKIGEKKVDTTHPEFLKAQTDVANRLNTFLSIKGKKSVDTFHRELGLMMWEQCGMARDEKGLKDLLKRIPALREEFWQNLSVPGSDKSLNMALEKAGRVADFLEFAELMATDALDRDESCGGHFRTEHQDDEGECVRDDDKFMNASVWEYTGQKSAPQKNIEPLTFGVRAPGEAELQMSDLTGEKLMKLTLHVWRQPDGASPGAMKTYAADNVNPHMSFLEMLDVVNDHLMEKGEEPIAFDHDCREGICGMCSMVINGLPHGGHPGVTVCQLHMRHFKDGDEIYIEPWRSRAFPVVKDLVVNRSAFDRIIASGGFVSVNTGGTPDANALPVPKKDADAAFDAATCIGCGACVAACKNGSAMLFVAAKVSHLNHLPQGQVERYDRAQKMTMQMDHEGFGTCTNLSQCEAVCPKEISVRVIADLNRDLIASQLKR